MSIAHTICASSRPSTPSVATAVPHRAVAAVRGVAAQLGVLVAATVAYLGVRALTQGDPSAAEANADAVLRVERAVGLDWERGAQALVLDHEGVVQAFNAVYVWAFWPFVAGALVALYRVDRGRYRVLRNAMFASGAAGLVVFALFPVAPPRFLEGFTDTVALVAGQDHLAHPSAFSNEYAAIPSFHVGWTILAVAVLLPVLRGPVLRALLVAQGAVMAVTVVVTANHYVVDGVIGVGVSLGALAVVRWLAARRAHGGLTTLLAETATHTEGAPRAARTATALVLQEERAA